MLDAITASRICTVTDPVTGELVTGTEDEIAAFLEFSYGMEAFESDVLASDDDASRVSAACRVWAVTPPVGRRRARGWCGWRAWSRDAALRARSLTATVRTAAAALIAAAATLVAPLVGADAATAARGRGPSSHPSGRLHRLPHAALTPRLAAR